MEQERELARPIIEALAKLSDDNSARKALEIASKEIGSQFFYDGDFFIVKVDGKEPVKIPIQQ
jgi:hypothetical protein